MYTKLLSVNRRSRYGREGPVKELDQWFRDDIDWRTLSIPWSSHGHISTICKEGRAAVD